MKEKIYSTTLSFIHELSSVSKDDDNNLSLEERLVKINQLSTDCIDCFRSLYFLKSINFDLI